MDPSLTTRTVVLSSPPEQWRSEIQQAPKQRVSGGWVQHVQVSYPVTPAPNWEAPIIIDGKNSKKEGEWSLSVKKNGHEGSCIMFVLTYVIGSVWLAGLTIVIWCGMMTWPPALLIGGLPLGCIGFLGILLLLGESKNSVVYSFCQTKGELTVSQEPVRCGAKTGSPFSTRTVEEVFCKLSYFEECHICICLRNGETTETNLETEVCLQAPNGLHQAMYVAQQLERVLKAKQRITSSWEPDVTTGTLALQNSASEILEVGEGDCSDYDVLALASP